MDTHNIIASQTMTLTFGEKSWTTTAVRMAYCETIFDFIVLFWESKWRNDRP